MRKTTLQDDIKRIIALHRELLERHSRQGEIIDVIPSLFESLESVVRELSIEISRAIDRIEHRQELTYQAILLIYGKQEHSTRGEQVFNTIKMESDKMVLTRLLAQEIRNLNTYQEQAALYGSTPPLHLINSIEKTEEKIARLKAELDD